MKNLIKPFLLSFIIVFGCAFFFVSSCKAYGEISENFDNYTLGNLSGQNSWYESVNNFDIVENSNCTSGKCISTENYINNIYTTFPINASTTSWIFDVYVKDLNYSPAEQVCFGFGISTTSGFNNSGFCLRGYNSSSFYFFGTSQTFNFNEHHTFEYYYDKETNLYSLYKGSNLIATTTTTIQNNYLILNSQNADNDDVSFDNFIFQDYIVSNPENVEIIDFEEWQGTVQVLSEELSIDKEKICFINTGACQISIRYNYDHIGMRAYLFEENYWDEDNIDTSDAYDSEILTASGTLKKVLDTQPQFTPAEENVYILILDSSNQVYKIQKTIVKYFETSEMESSLICGTICDDMATSTDDSFWSGVTYGLECGIRKLTCWMFQPDSESLTKFAEAKFAIETAFPFSVYYQISNALQSTNIASTTGENLTMTWSTFSLPSNETMIMASSTMMAQTWGTLWTTLYELIESILYLSIGGYFLFRLINLARKRESATI